MIRGGDERLLDRVFDIVISDSSIPAPRGARAHDAGGVDGMVVVVVVVVVLCSSLFEVDVIKGGELRAVRATAAEGTHTSRRQRRRQQQDREEHGCGASRRTLMRLRR